MLGGEEEDGTKNPFMLTFIFKAGLNSHIDCTDKEKFRNERPDEKACTYQADGARGVHSPVAEAETLTNKGFVGL